MTRRAALLVASFSPALWASADREKAAVDLDGRKISIEYEPVCLEGRRFGGTLAPYGKVWRFGAEAPRITVNAYTLTVLFELLPGTYPLFVIPYPEKWIMIPSTATDGKTYVSSNDVGRLELPVRKLAKPVEQLAFRLTRQASNVARLSIEIDRASVSTDLKVL